MKKLVLALIALAAIVAVATPALADYNFYGSMRFKTGYTVTADQPNRSSDSSQFGLQSNTRFGLNATTGNIGGRIEMGLLDGTGSANVYTRLMYGTLKTDAGTLLIGQTYNPYWTAYAMVYNNDDGLNGFGELYEQRTPQIKFDFNSGLYVSAIQNQAIQKSVANSKALLPKLNVGFKNKAGALSYNLGVAYQVYDQYYGAAFAPVAASSVTNVGGVATPNAAVPVTDNKRTIQSYLTYFELVMKQETMTAQMKLHYGQNLAEFGFKRDKSYNAVGNNNTESYGGVAQVSVDMFNVGFSYTVDADDTTAKTDKDVVAFVNAVIKPVKGFSITPEIAYYDNNVNGFDFDGADMVVGTIKWQMDF
jgi:hypothetical protein